MRLVKGNQDGHDLTLAKPWFSYSLACPIFQELFLPEWKKFLHEIIDITEKF
jgi:hypothetical protein